MRKASSVAAAAVATIALTLSPASATSGGLDVHGGHHCWTNCKSQGYYKGQYHCHKRLKHCKNVALPKHRAHGH